MSDDDYEYAPSHYQTIAAKRALRREVRRLTRERHPCNQTPCTCGCVHCVQARKYDKATHCKGKK